MSSERTDTLFGDLRRSHQARTARRRLERQLTTYRTGTEITELEAIADRNPDQDSRAIRDYLERNGRGMA